MVDFLAKHGVSAEGFASNPSVFINKLPINHVPDVTRELGSALSFVSARLRAGFRAAFETGLDGEPLTTLKASDIGTDVTLRIAFPKPALNRSGNVGMRACETGSTTKARRGAMAFSSRELPVTKLAEFEKRHENLLSTRDISFDFGR